MKINSYMNFRYSLKTKTLNIEKRLIKSKNSELIIDGHMAHEYPENISNDMIIVAETLNRSMPNINVPEVTWRDCPATIPVFKVIPEKGQIKFCVNMGNTRLDRELCNNMYDVIIKKYTFDPYD
jgi:hypothetical protein